MKLLDKKELNLTPILTISQTIILFLIFLMTLANSGRLGKLSSNKPTLVELQDGTSIRAIPIGEKERSNPAIMNFVGKTMMNLMSWNAVPKSEETDPRKIKLDSGVPVGTGNKKLTTNSWEAGFALSEDFRASFLREIANLTPIDVFTGDTQSALLVRHISEPEKISQGNWRIKIVSTIVIFQNKDESGKGISFNKDIYVRAVDTPPLPNNPSRQLLAAYNARKAGMEIYKIQDLDLGK